MIKKKTEWNLLHHMRFQSFINDINNSKRLILKVNTIRTVNL